MGESGRNSQYGDFEGNFFFSNSNCYIEGVADVLACCIHLCTVNYVRLSDAILCENLGKEIIIYDEKVKEKAKNMMENERKKKENRVSVR